MQGFCFSSYNDFKRKIYIIRKIHKYLKRMKNDFEFCQLFFSEGISEHKDPNI
ncbi:MAG: hypothetical protein QG646_762 [Euryarchaeota archaeon]|nr:hypothetical protein [Euryarchaeota archaeon]